MPASNWSVFPSFLIPAVRIVPWDESCWSPWTLCSCHIHRPSCVQDGIPVSMIPHLPRSSDWSAIRCFRSPISGSWGLSGVRFANVQMCWFELVNGESLFLRTNILHTHRDVWNERYTPMKSKSKTGLLNWQLCLYTLPLLMTGLSRRQSQPRIGGCSHHCSLLPTMRDVTWDEDDWFPQDLCSHHVRQPSCVLAFVLVNPQDLKWPRATLGTPSCPPPPQISM
ncbi:uncharacterized protein [Narcine bancroftii]|uniref:uncharacterized protein n=1 Tax=Narcine bancroftii TaxID=1343680 RepID=UPI0038315039